jgi:excisionase family DNA binding protein
MQAEATREALSVSQAARKLGVSPDWIRTLCNRGELDSYRVGNGWRLIPAAAIEDYALIRAERTPPVDSGNAR